MILFRNDFARYPSATIHYETTNKSFLDMAEKYRQMGVKNNVFHLALLNPTLKGIDPFSEILSQEMKIAIYTECQYNPWYFFREICRVPPQAGRDPVRIQANRGNIALWWSFLAGLDFCLIQPRQTGKSVSSDCLMAYLLFIGTANSRINMLTKDNGLRVANVERLKEIRDLLPNYIVVKDKKDANNSNEITYHTLGNHYATAVAQQSRVAAMNVGRGTTAPTAQIDEPPFVKNLRYSLPAMLAAGGAARDEARLNGVPAGTIFTTTAGKIDDPDGGYFYDLLSNGTIWNERFFDATSRKNLVNLVMNASVGKRGILINGTFSHRQLGKTDEWLNSKISEAKAHGDDADRDYFNRWTRGALSSPLSIKLNTIIADSVVEAEYTELTEEGYMVRWYIPEDEIQETLKHTHVVIGTDSSDAIGNDSIALVGVDVRTGGTLFAATINETNLIVFCKFLSNFLIRYTNTTLIIEKRSTGQMIVDALVISLLAAGEDPFKRIFNRVVQDHDERESDYRAIQSSAGGRRDDVYVEYKKDFGFNTTGKSRDLLYKRVIQDAAKMSGQLVKDARLSSEIRGLVTKNGRVDHSAGAHDDMVIAWLLAHWFLTFGKNLKHYGIKEEQCLSLVTKSNKTMTSDDVAAMKGQQRIREEIEKVNHDLQNANSGFTVAVLENKLRVLTKKLSISGAADVKSIDGLIKEARDERLRRRSGVNTSNVRSIDQRNDKPLIPQGWWKRKAA